MADDALPKLVPVTIRRGKNVEELVLRLLSEKEIKGLSKLGTAGGRDIFHCIYMAQRNHPDFFSDAVGYAAVRPEDRMAENEGGHRYPCQINFYGK